MILNLGYSAEDFLTIFKDWLLTLVIKNQSIADQNETTDSAKLSRQFMYIMNGYDVYEDYQVFTRNELIAVGITDLATINLYLADKSKIPSIYHKALLENKRKYIRDQYVEHNNYYRRFMGLPDLNEATILLKDGRPVNSLNDMELYKVRDEIEELKKNNPLKRYLWHLKSQDKIDFYTARRAKPFELLNYSKSMIHENYIKSFIDIYNEVVVYVQSVLYNTPYEYQKFYDNFVILLIVTLATHRFFNEKFRYYIQREFYTYTELQNMFYSYGLPWKYNIPFRYLQRIVKNMNYLIKYKGTNLVLTNLLEIFGYEDSTIYQHILFKDLKYQSDSSILAGLKIEEIVDLIIRYEVKEIIPLLKIVQINDPFYNINLSKADLKAALLREEKSKLITLLTELDKDTDGKNNNPIIRPSVMEENFDLKFIRTPIDDINITKYLEEEINIEDYDLVTQADKFWGTALDNNSTILEDIKKKIKQTAYNFIKTKYISIGAIVRLTQANIEISYLFTLIRRLKNEGLIDDLVFFSKELKPSGNMTTIYDLIIAMTILLFKRFGYDDIIPYTPTKIGWFYAYDFNKNIDILIKKIKSVSSTSIDYLKNKGYLKLLEANSPLVHKKDLIDLYKELKYYRLLLHEAMEKTEDYDEYKALQEIDNFYNYSLSTKCALNGIDTYYTVENEKLECLNPGFDRTSNTLYKAKNILIDSTKTIKVKLNNIPVQYNYIIDYMTGTLKFNLSDNDFISIDKKDLFTIDYSYYKNTEEYNTYTEYLKDHDLELYDYIKNYFNDEEKILTGLNNLITIMDTFLNSNELELIFKRLMYSTGDVIKKYLIFMINLFKSYKVQFRDLSTYYLFDDKYFNLIKLLTVIMFKVSIGYNENVSKDIIEVLLSKIEMIQDDKDLLELTDKILFIVNLMNIEKPGNTIELTDWFKFLVEYLIENKISLRGFLDRFIFIRLDDNLKELKEFITFINKFNNEDKFMLKDKLIEFTSKLSLKNELINLFMTTYYNTNFISNDKINNLKEVFRANPTYNLKEDLSLLFKQIVDKISINTDKNESLIKFDYYDHKTSFNLGNTVKLIDRYVLKTNE